MKLQSWQIRALMEGRRLLHELSKRATRPEAAAKRLELLLDDGNRCTLRILSDLLREIELEIAVVIRVEDANP